jgi:hypothetical protein
MQISLRKAIASVLVAGAALAATAANAATIINVPATNGGSDLVLFVSDPTSGQYFAEDLGVTMTSLVSQSQVISDGVLTSPKTFTVPTLSGGAALSSFLAGIAGDVAAGDVSYSIMAADDFSSTETAGASRALVTSVNNYGQSPLTPVNTFTNGSVHSFAAGAKTFFADINNNYAGGNTSASYGWGVGTGATLAPNSFISASLGNGALIGTQQTMYIFGINGSGVASVSNVYVGATIDLSANGTITVTNGSATPVPLPAAVWLLGSGLLGLVGVGRRRRAAAVAV